MSYNMNITKFKLLYKNKKKKIEIMQSNLLIVSYIKINLND